MMADWFTVTESSNNLLVDVNLDNVLTMTERVIDQQPTTWMLFVGSTVTAHLELTVPGSLNDIHQQIAQQREPICLMCGAQGHHKIGTIRKGGGYYDTVR